MTANARLMALTVLRSAMNRPIRYSAKCRRSGSLANRSAYGRVFAMRAMIAWSAVPLAYLVAGPLADRVFEPLLTEHGPLATNLGQFIGVGPGRGVGLLFMAMGGVTLLTTATAYLYPRLRFLEKELPDAIANDVPEEPPPIVSVTV